MQKLMSGAEIDVEIEKGVYRGVGLARHGGKVVLVPRALPGDCWRVRLTSVRADYANAEPIERLVDGPGRREAPCPHAARCGGCAYQELEPGSQRDLKARILREALDRARVRWDGSIEVRSGPQDAWRTRASLHVAWAAGRPILGFHEQGTHRVVEVGRCGQLTPGLNAAIAELRGALPRCRELRNRLIGIDLAEGGDRQSRVATLVVDSDGFDVSRALGAFCGRVSGLTGLGLSVRSGRGPFRLIRGAPFTWSPVAGARFRVHARSFFQANQHLAEELVKEVVSGLPDGGVVLDLYAGVGLFGLSAASGRERVLAVEANPFAAADAVHNRDAAGHRRTLRVDCGDTRQALDSWPAADGERVILDPPRTGAGRDVVEAISRRRPASVTYVSCDPATLARDAATFQDVGFTIAGLVGFDLFPDTFHVEAVARLFPR